MFDGQRSYAVLSHTAASASCRGRGNSNCTPNAALPTAGDSGSDEFDFQTVLYPRTTWMWEADQTIISTPKFRLTIVGNNGTLVFGARCASGWWVTARGNTDLRRGDTSAPYTSYRLRALHTAKGRTGQLQLFLCEIKAPAGCKMRAEGSLNVTLPLRNAATVTGVTFGAERFDGQSLWKGFRGALEAVRLSVGGLGSTAAPLLNCSAAPTAVTWTVPTAAA